MKINFLKLGIATIALLSTTAIAQAEIVRTKTIVQPEVIEGVNSIEFSAFDANKDGQYSMKEVGETLFYIFDTDGNEVIDNIEWDNRNVYTITPMKKETYEFVDYNEDGFAETSTYTYETLWQESGLIKFDKNGNGLSAKEFIDTSFQELDDNDNNTIELDEWQEVYTKMVKPASAEQERYN